MMKDAAAPERGRTGRPPRTSRAQILGAARELIDDEGWERLTMRKLAARAGVAPTTLYHHVRDREELLAALLDDYADRIPRRELPRQPVERILAAATVMHDALAGWPWLVEVLTADDLIGDAALWMVEAIVDAAMEHGCPADEAVHLYRSIWYYTVGEILVRANADRKRAELDRPAYRDTVFRRLDKPELPRLSAIAGCWPALCAEDTYLQGLRALVEGLLTK
ncbi:TetR/AcrR family transcriptional regulator [Sciscionella marina]|uniref:TetR/AcrR family transcriptional regulator n=1 Tax=Sciscionella marina TaxID=508770 RepID=UPI00036F2AD8|nr:TetR/AcrR family transcriptional regulator [Sciscionella marina]